MRNPFGRAAYYIKGRYRSLVCCVDVAIATWILTRNCIDWEIVNYDWPPSKCHWVRKKVEWAVIAHEFWLRRVGFGLTATGAAIRATRALHNTIRRTAASQGVQF